MNRRQIIREAKERQDKGKPHCGGWYLSTDWQKYVMDVISLYDREAAKRYDTAFWFLEKLVDKDCPYLSKFLEKLVDKDCSYLSKGRNFYQIPFEDLVDTYFNYNTELVMENE